MPARTPEQLERKRAYDRQRIKNNPPSLQVQVGKIRKQNEIYMNMMDSPEFSALFIRNKGRARRKCLRCAQLFRSEHEGNRVCGSCQIKNRRYNE